MEVVTKEERDAWVEREAMERHKGRSAMTVKLCVCGRKAIRCGAISGKNRHCKNRPRLCGFCAAHCTGHKTRRTQ